MSDDLMITTHDLVRSAAVLAAAVGAGGLLYTGLNGMPGFVWACLVGLAAGTWEHSRKCRGGRAARKDLSSLSKGYVRAAIGAVFLAFVVPVLVPASAFESGSALVWADGVLLMGGLMAVPSAHALLGVAGIVARRRPSRSDHG